MTMKTLLNELKIGLSASFGDLSEVPLTAADWDAVHQLAETKYCSWEWNFGRTPRFTIKHRFQCDSTGVDAHVHIKNAVIEDIVILDQTRDPRRIEPKVADLIGMRYDPAHPDLKAC
jgi:lipoate-protein ligase A